MESWEFVGGTRNPPKEGVLSESDKPSGKVEPCELNCDPYKAVDLPEVFDSWDDVDPYLLSLGDSCLPFKEGLNTNIEDSLAGVL